MNTKPAIQIACCAALALAAAGAPAQTPNPSFNLIGHIERFALTTPGDALSAATMTVRGIPVTLPRSLLVTLPGQYLTAQDLFRGPQGGAVQAASGLALADVPPPPVAFEAELQGNIVGGQYIAGVARISQGRAAYRQWRHPVDRRRARRAARGRAGRRRGRARAAERPRGHLRPGQRRRCQGGAGAGSALPARSRQLARACAHRLSGLHPARWRATLNAQPATVPAAPANGQALHLWHGGGRAAGARPGRLRCAAAGAAARGRPCGLRRHAGARRRGRFRRSRARAGGRARYLHRPLRRAGVCLHRGCR